MLLIDAAVAEGQLTEVLTALIDQPFLAAFLALLVVSGFLIAALIFRKHTFRVLRRRSAEGWTQTSVAVDPPVKEYLEIEGLIQVEVTVEEEKKEAS